MNKIKCLYEYQLLVGYFLCIDEYYENGRERSKCGWGGTIQTVVTYKHNVVKREGQRPCMV